MSYQPISDSPDSGNTGAPEIEGWLMGMERVVAEQADELARLSRQD